MTNKNNKVLHVSLWIAQVFLAFAFIMAGVMKATSPINDLVAKGLTWTADLPLLTRFIGISELLGGLGLVLPAALRIKPVLTPVAAAALTVVMGLAVGFHITHGDAAQQIVPSVVLGLGAAFVAWGRFKKAPVQ